MTKSRTRRFAAVLTEEWRSWFVQALAGAIGDIDQDQWLENAR
jgi:hypothetical protein